MEGICERTGLAQHSSVHEEKPRPSGRTQEEPSFHEQHEVEIIKAPRCVLTMAKGCVKFSGRLF